MRIRDARPAWGGGGGKGGEGGAAAATAVARKQTAVAGKKSVPTCAVRPRGVAPVFRAAVVYGILLVGRHEPWHSEWWKMKFYDMSPHPDFSINRDRYRVGEHL